MYQLTGKEKRETKYCLFFVCLKSQKSFIFVMIRENYIKKGEEHKKMTYHTIDIPEKETLLQQFTAYLDILIVIPKKD